MMTKEEMASIVKYCNDNGVSYKARLSELGVPEWKFFVSKRRYAKEQASSASPAGEFLQLTAGGDIYTTSKMVGHTNVHTTEIYADVAMEKKVDAVNLMAGIFG